MGNGKVDQRVAANQRLFSLYKPVIRRRNPLVICLVKKLRSQCLCGQIDYISGYPEVSDDTIICAGCLKWIAMQSNHQAIKRTQIMRKKRKKKGFFAGQVILPEEHR